ncbi:hypothetical protein GUJ93_ZPchr0007g3171 [Zizania palustris]|uniref:No apical meristem-associated C-terminal domain-containing protein n=1 Tax=Zizania palustris TaxID=103762 RepID=A0A8J5TDY2_ZIZPA|nr:hypothetical protein GUJ93_ZPchr0007g3171 [Zizania palustris]
MESGCDSPFGTIPRGIVRFLAPAFFPCLPLAFPPPQAGYKASTPRLHRKARNHSGCSIDDKIASACAIFKEDDKLHMNFPYMHCWKILKDQPKWIERRKHMNAPKPPLKPATKKQKTSANTSLAAFPLAITAADVQTTQSANERPAGKKKEKQNLCQRATMEAIEYLVAKKREASAEKELKKEERCRKPLRCRKKGYKLKETGWICKGKWKKKGS